MNNPTPADTGTSANSHIDHHVTISRRADWLSVIGSLMVASEDASYTVDQGRLGDLISALARDIGTANDAQLEQPKNAPEKVTAADVLEVMHRRLQDGDTGQELAQDLSAYMPGNATAAPDKPTQTRSERPMLDNAIQIARDVEGVREVLAANQDQDNARQLVDLLHSIETAAEDMVKGGEAQARKAGERLTVEEKLNRAAAIMDLVLESVSHGGDTAGIGGSAATAREFVEQAINSIPVASMSR